MTNDEIRRGEDLLQKAKEPEDNPQTADKIVSASLLSGSLTDVCDVSVSV